MEVAHDRSSHNQRRDAAGFKAATNIMASWGADAQLCQKILKIGKTTYHKYKSTPEKTKLSDDQLERISYILNMHQALRIVFSNPENVKGFMGMVNHNDYFAGRAPLDVIGTGRFADLYEVAKRVDCLRGGLWG